MKNIIFIAPPAAGKGTQSEYLVEKYGYTHISTGDLLRSEMETHTELGNSLTEIMASGTLVSDEIVTELLKKKLTSISNCFILDGYPRNINQAKTLTELLKELNIELDTVIYLDMEEDIAMHRAVGRMSCPKCHEGYNKYIDGFKPKKEFFCDECGVELVSRSDDNEETFKIRFKEYLKNTEPLLDYYKELGYLKVIDNSGSPEEIFTKIEEVI